MEAKYVENLDSVPLVTEGLLLVDKPRGWTSFDVVAKIRGVLEAARRRGEIDFPGKRLKVGHTGTLDPLATGLLVVAVGSTTKQIQSLTKLDKTYQVELTLGQTSSTGDEEGDKTHVSDAKPTQAAVAEAVQSFIGEIQQVPPKYSAVKVNGQRAYKLARQGKEVTIDPRTVTIHAVTELQYEYPRVTFTAKVSSGTYIRTLAEDIGKKLHTGAYMSNLHRTEVGEFRLEY